MQKTSDIFHPNNLFTRYMVLDEHKPDDTNQGWENVQLYDFLQTILPSGRMLSIFARFQRLFPS